MSDIEEIDVSLKITTSQRERFIYIENELDEDYDCLKITTSQRERFI